MSIIRLAITIAIFMVAFLLITPCLADILIIGEKPYTYRYIINNTDAYPDYTFLTTNEIMPEPYPNLIENGSFGGGYKLNGFILHAVKRSLLDAGVIDILKSKEKTEKNLTSYFENLPVAISNLSLPVGTSINDSIPLDNITVILTVHEINGTVFNITKTKTLYGFENGTVAEELIRQGGAAQSENPSLNAEMKSLESFS